MLRFNGLEIHHNMVAYIRFQKDNCLRRKQFKQFIRNQKEFPSFLQSYLLKNGAGINVVTKIAETFKRIHTCCSCGKQATNKCGECLATYYCDIACQMEDWPKHQVNCQNLKQDMCFLRLQPPIQEFFMVKYKRSVVSFNTFMKVIKRKCYQVTFNKEW